MMNERCLSFYPVVVGAVSVLLGKDEELEGDALLCWRTIVGSD